MASVKLSKLMFIFTVIVLCYLIVWTLFNESVVLKIYDITWNTLNESFLTKNITILLWNPIKCKDCAPFAVFKSGNVIFKEQNCDFQNCYIHPNNERLPFVNPENYDAIMFNGRPIRRMGLNKLPQKRRDDQIYIFVQMESASRFPMCQSYFDDFFNWTMTYRLDSDIPWTYFKVTTKNDVAVGPNENIQWIAEGDLHQISDVLKTTLNNKYKLVAWFVSNCYFGNSDRINFVKTLKDELKRIDDQLSVDIYGKCGTLSCYKNESERCNKVIEKDYKFYLAMENSLDEDYITEKVLKPLQYNALPIVYSAANYSRYLPPGSYLDAWELGPKELAKKMHELHQNAQEYYKYFRWKREYKYFDNFNIAGTACKLCERLNTDKVTSRHLRFREWWNKDFVIYC